MIGKLLGNRYEILEPLGGGGMAIIYKGRDNYLNRIVTIKILRPEFTCDEDFVKRFHREAQAVASLSHPNIVSIYDVGKEEKVHYLVMEYVKGDNLKNLIRKDGVLTPERAVEIARQVSEALQHAHENNIVHRDVKPQNILITREGRVKLTDFGIAREATTATLTQTDAVVGSVHYLSPEQARGETAGPQSDIYSLGTVLYEMVTGVLPFQGDTPIGVALKHIREDPPRPSKLNPAVKRGLENIITRAMSKLPADRYKSAQLMATELEALSLPGKVPGDRKEIVAADKFATTVIPVVGSGEEGLQHQEEINTGKYRYVWLWVSLLVLGLMAAGIVAFYLYVNVPEIKLPSVEGKTLAEARDVLQGLGLENIQVSKNSHPTVPADRIISQDPPPDTRIKVTRNVVLSVSQGPEYRTVPHVIGLTLSAARIEINKNELNVAGIDKQYNHDYPEEVVFNQDPGGDFKLPKGSGVVLYVSKGPQPVIRQVPDLTGFTLDEAGKELDKLNLILDDENAGGAASTSYFSGQVIAQNPAGGAEVEEGTAVQVTVSSGPGPSRRLARVKVDIPDDRRKHELSIVVQDAKGSNEVYFGTHAPGKKVIKEVPYYGSAYVKVYIDKELVGEQSFE